MLLIVFGQLATLTDNYEGNDRLAMTDKEWHTMVDKQQTSNDRKGSILNRRKDMIDRLTTIEKQ